MCCLRYEDQTYKELGARLPKKGKRVGTSDGPGVVIDTKLLVQLALVKLEHNGEEIAVPIEELLDPEMCPQPGTAEFDRRRAEARAKEDPLRGMDPAQVQSRERSGSQDAGPDRHQRTKSDQQDAFRRRSQQSEKEGSREGRRNDGRGRADRRGQQRDGAAGQRNRPQDPRRSGQVPDERPTDSVPGAPGAPNAGAPGASGPGAPGAAQPEGRASRRKRRRRRRRGGPPGADPGGAA
jgi:hypothetical protein